MSFIELIVFIVVVALTLVTLSKVYAYSMAFIHKPLINHQLLTLAQSHVALIATRRFDENTPNKGTPCDISVVCAGIGLDVGENLLDLNTLDDIDDFHGYTKQSPQGFSQKVSVIYAGDLFGINKQHAKRITVTVENNRGDRAHFSIYRFNH